MTDKKPNRLIREKSPYLLQHAHNPVDWFPWGDEAFEKAKKEDKPVLLSIGYSTCHWCHVMERESFEDEAIAAVMNEHLVSIKVDREERPDVDKIYMTAVQAMTGAGGWPLNVFLTPDGDPIIGGTYFPPQDRGGRPGWPSLVRRIGTAWRDAEKRPQMIGAGRDLMDNLERHLAAAPEGGAVGAEALAGVVDAFRGDHDLDNGGFGRSPKFPMPVYQHLLFRFYDWARRVPGRGAEAAEGLGMALNALRAMSKGGIYDHLGGGFSRYSTDERWHLPHFEKMLYDNAQLALNFMDAFSITGEAAFAATAKETLDYVLRDMTHPEGGFFSAEDADSFPAEGAKEKVEGSFYVWEKGEVEKILGEDAGLFIAYYGVREAGNVEEDPHGEFPDKNVLHVVRPLEEVAAHARLTPAEAKKRLGAARAKLFAVRARRPRPHLDDKILVSWNGLMISALARGAVALDDKKYLEYASKCASFLRDRLWKGPKGPLLRRWRDGDAAIPAMADDLAFLTQGLLDLFQAGGDPQWLSWAETLGDLLLRDFYDGEHGGFSMTPAVHDEKVRFRPREDMDNVEPSAASVAVSAFLSLSRLTDREDFHHAAEKTLAAHGPDMAEYPRQFPYMLSGLITFLSPPAEIVVAGAPQDPSARLLLTAARTRFMPGALVFALDDGPAGKALAARLPSLAAMRPVDGKAAAYVCTNFACRPPITDARALAELLDK